jgi:hypothetical protein
VVVEVEVEVVEEEEEGEWLGGNLGLGVKI